MVVISLDSTLQIPPIDQNDDPAGTDLYVEQGPGPGCVTFIR